MTLADDKSTKLAESLRLRVHLRPKTQVMDSQMMH